MSARCAVPWSTNDDFLAATTRTLSRLALVVWARSREVAVEKTESLRPEVVVIDAGTGIDVGTARSLRAGPRAPEVLVIGSSDGEADGDPGVDGVLPCSGIEQGRIPLIGRLLDRGPRAWSERGRGPCLQRRQRARCSRSRIRRLQC